MQRQTKRCEELLPGKCEINKGALFGQTTFHPDKAKNTYGTGLFVLMYTGTKPKELHGLFTTVTYHLDHDGPVHYALEGYVSHSRSIIQSLRDNLQIIPSAPDFEALATLSTVTKEERNCNLIGWKIAMLRNLGWINENGQTPMKPLVWIVFKNPSWRPK
ncbi:hypothetical protein ACA910_007471 [Epithemia clementina (nom. ined.)]